MPGSHHTNGYLFLDRHHRHARVNLRRQGQHDGVLDTINTHSHALLNVRRRDVLAQRDDVLGDLHNDIAATRTRAKTTSPSPLPPRYATRVTSSHTHAGYVK